MPQVARSHTAHTRTNECREKVVAEKVAVRRRRVEIEVRSTEDGGTRTENERLVVVDGGLRAERVRKQKGRERGLQAPIRFSCASLPSLSRPTAKDRKTTVPAGLCAARS